MKTTLLFFFAITLFSSSASSAPAEPGGDSTLLPESTIRILRYVHPIFPLRLSRQGVSSGEAKVAFELDATGRLIDVLPISYTHKGFADSTVEAMRGWRFEPAKLEGKPVSTVGELAMHFETNGVLVVAKLTNLSENPSGTLMYQPCDPSRLDRTPTLVHVVEPYFPRQYFVEGATGLVSLDFYIDEQGRVRMPMVKGATAGYLAGITVAAVRQWRFEPPTSRGKPVLVHVNQEFNFAPKSDG